MTTEDHWLDIVHTPLTAESEMAGGQKGLSDTESAINLLAAGDDDPDLWQALSSLTRTGAEWLFRRGALLSRLQSLDTQEQHRPLPGPISDPPQS